MIDINSNFNFNDIRKKYPYDLNKSDVILDIKKVFLVSDSTPEVFLFKYYDAINCYVKVSYTNERTAKEKLIKIIVGERIIKKGNKRRIKMVSLWDIYFENTLLFTVKGLAFYSNDPEILSYYRHYDYLILNKVNYEIIKPFLKHLEEVMCDNIAFFAKK